MKAYIYLNLLFLLMLSSCVKDIDVEQSEEFRFQPVLTASLVNFERTAIKFYESTDKDEDVIIIKEEVESEIFNGDFTKENLSKAELTFDIKNSISRPFSVKIDFCDTTGKSRQTISLDIDGSKDGEDISLVHNEIFVGDKLDDLKESEKITLTLSMLKGPVNEGGRIKMRSKATFHFSINTAD